MSELVSGSTPEGPSGAAGGTPSESDLPAMQGLGDAADDPSDPEAAEQRPDTSQGQRLGDLGRSGDDQASSDPMPDTGGSAEG
jgi:hypothetical protein